MFISKALRLQRMRTKVSRLIMVMKMVLAESCGRPHNLVPFVAATEATVGMPFIKCSRTKMGPGDFPCCSAGKITLTHFRTRTFYEAQTNSGRQENICSKFKSIFLISIPSPCLQPSVGGGSC